MKFHQYGRVRAIFEPKRLDTLKPAARKFIGREAVFEALWQITEEDGGSYIGQFAMSTPRDWVTNSDDSNAWSGSFGYQKKTSALSRFSMKA